MTESQDMRRGAPFRVSDESAQGDLRRQRAEALTVRCPICAQPAGLRCRNPFTGGALIYPAHLARARESERQADQ